MDDCIFCKIVNKEIPSTVVYEDDKVVAFNDINPEAPVHVLIVPRNHIPDLNHINADNADVIADIHIAAGKVAQKLNIAQSGYRLICNCGVGVGQTVFHIHYHLVGGKNLGPKILYENVRSEKCKEGKS